MGLVTNVVLMAAHFDPGIGEFNDWLIRQGHSTLCSVSEVWDCSERASKKMSVDVCIGAFNYLPREKCVAAFRACKWRYPARVRLVLDGFEYFRTFTPDTQSVMVTGIESGED